MKSSSCCAKHDCPKVKKPDGRLRCPKCMAESTRKYHLQKTFGISVEEYDAQLKRQKGRCAICRTKKPGKGRNGEDEGTFMVDHDHETGAIRGLLCRRCNLMLGYAREKAKILKRAAEYVEVDGVVPILNDKSLAIIEQWSVDQNCYVYLRPLSSKLVDSTSKERVYWSVSVEMRTVPPGQWRGEGYNLDDVLVEMAERVPRTKDEHRELAGWLAPESVLAKEVEAAKAKSERPRKRPKRIVGCQCDFDPERKIYKSMTGHRTKCPIEKAHTGPPKRVNRVAKKKKSANKS